MKNLYLPLLTFFILLGSVHQVKSQTVCDITPATIVACVGDDVTLGVDFSGGTVPMNPSYSWVIAPAFTGSAYFGSDPFNGSTSTSSTPVLNFTNSATNFQLQVTITGDGGYYCTSTKTFNISGAVSGLTITPSSTVTCVGDAISLTGAP